MLRILDSTGMDKKKRAKSNREEEKKVALKRDAKQGYREVVQKFGLNFELFKLFASTRRLGSSRSGLPWVWSCSRPWGYLFKYWRQFSWENRFQNSFFLPFESLQTFIKPFWLVFISLCQLLCAIFQKENCMNTLSECIYDIFKMISLTEHSVHYLCYSFKFG